MTPWKRWMTGRVQPSVACWKIRMGSAVTLMSTMLWSIVTAASLDRAARTGLAQAGRA
jgi:hypothetical protein